MTYSVLLTREAEEDLDRLFNHLLERELERDGGDLELAHQALTAVTISLQMLERFPFTCRKATANPFLRELLIPFGASGYLALFEILDDKTVAIAAVRHQREDDYH